MRAMLGDLLANYDARAACGVLVVVVGIFIGWVMVLFNRKSKPVLDRASRLPLEDGGSENENG
jgi:cbb3-type cytochrome oxidase subunit 3